MKTQGKNIIVTGGGNGVGRKLVLKLLSKGAKVFAIDINEEALKETVVLSQNNPNLYTYPVDISNREAVFAFAQKVIDEHHEVDALINNAGVIQPFIHLKDLDMNRIERVMDINFYGTLNMIKAFLPYLLKRPEAHIVNVSSMGGFLPVPGQSVYGASKAAVKLLSEGLHSELIDTNVHVSVVIPGGIATDIKKNSHISHNVSTETNESHMILSADQAADLIIHAMEKNRLCTYIGKDCNIMKLLYKIKPSLAMFMINKVMGAHAH
jgi:short-subunit dehydrogenase